MSLYRKKPIVVEATQWRKNGDHPLDYAGEVHGLEGGVLRTFSGDHRRERGWEGSVVRHYRHPDTPGLLLCPQCGATMHDHGWIDSTHTLQPGGHTICPGDWVITEQGDPTKYYPCKPGVFAATYDPWVGDAL
jgi:hypothetical protein